MKKFCISRNQPFGRNKSFISILMDFLLVELKSCFRNKHVDLGLDIENFNLIYVWDRMAFQDLKLIFLQNALLIFSSKKLMKWSQLCIHCKKGVGWLVRAFFAINRFILWMICADWQDRPASIQAPKCSQRFS